MAPCYSYRFDDAEIDARPVLNDNPHLIQDAASAASAVEHLWHAAGEAFHGRPSRLAARRYPAAPVVNSQTRRRVQFRREPARGSARCTRERSLGPRPARRFATQYARPGPSRSSSARHTFTIPPITNGDAAKALCGDVICLPPGQPFEGAPWRRCIIPARLVVFAGQHCSIVRAGYQDNPALRAAVISDNGGCGNASKYPVRETGIASTLLVSCSTVDQLSR